MFLSADHVDSYVCLVNLVLVKYILNLYLTFYIPDVGWEDDIITNYNAVLSLQMH